MSKTHFIAMAGLHGYLPQFCELCETYTEAVDALAQLHELGKKRTQQLRRDAYLELNLKRDGNEYAEIEDCDCSTPEIHGE